jgi:hypothetical protein
MEPKVKLQRLNVAVGEKHFVKKDEASDSKDDGTNDLLKTKVELNLKQDQVSASMSAADEVSVSMSAADEAGGCHD